MKFSTGIIIPAGYEQEIRAYNWQNRRNMATNQDPEEESSPIQVFAVRQGDSDESEEN